MCRFPFFNILLFQVIFYQNESCEICSWKKDTPSDSKLWNINLILHDQMFGHSAVCAEDLGKALFYM